MKPYNDLIKNIIDNGYSNPNDRTGVGRRSIFSTQTRFKMSEGFPMVTCRKTFSRTIIEEVLWFIKGSQDNQSLNDKNVHIWDPWCITEEHVEKMIKRVEPDMPDEGKTLVVSSLMTEYKQKIGPMYGYLWRNAPSYNFSQAFPKVTEDDIASDKLATYKEEFEKLKPQYEPINETDEPKFVKWEDFINARHYQTIDQLQNLIINLKKRPYSARHLVTSLVPEYVPFEDLSPQENILLGKGCLAPCHVMFQCFVFPPKQEGGKKRISLQMFQRSVDTMVGAAINIPSYALLLCLLAHVTDMEADEFIYTTGDTHLYLSHIEDAKIQISREPKPSPTLWLNPEVKDLFKFTSDDIKVSGYTSHEPIKYEIAV